MQLFDFQEEIFEKVKRSCTNDIVQLDTGAGKTPVEAALAQYYENVILVAHRNILIAQISEKMAAFGIYHDTISTEHTRRRCMQAHKIHGKNFIQRGNKNKLVCSIQSLYSKYKRLELNIDKSKNYTILIDEGHHVIVENTWGKLREIFPNARIIAFTATPGRNDGESLHVSKGGLFENLIQSDNLKEDSVKKLIEMGRLSDFKVYAPYIYLDKNEIAVNNNIVNTYKNIANNKQTIAICPSIKNAEEMAQQFKEGGIKAACINSLMSIIDVDRIIDLFKNKMITVLFSVDMIGEGFDVPNVEALMLLRRTNSFLQYKQWIGRVLRYFKGKEYGVIIDFCNNVMGDYENPGHGMPDESVIWDLINPPKNLGLLKCAACFNCGFMYKLKLKECPDCGYENKLHNREILKNYYKLLINVDTSLIEIAKREFEKVNYEEKLKKEIIFNYNHFNNEGNLGRASFRIATSLISTLKDRNIDICSINSFVEKTKNVNFWINNFTVADINNTKKHLKVYEKWLKSQ